MEKYEIRFSYDLIGRIDYYFREHCLEILDKAYDEEVCYTYLCDHDNSADFQELSNGKFLPRFIERTLIEVPVTIKSSRSQSDMIYRSFNLHLRRQKSSSASSSGIRSSSSLHLRSASV